MSEIDQRTSNAIARLRAEWSAPEGVEERMLADFHARLGSGPDGDGGADAPSSGGSGSVGAAGQALHVAKIILAVAGLTAAGLAGVVVVAKLMRPADRQAPSAREQVVANAPQAEIEVNEAFEATEPEPGSVESIAVESSPIPSEPELAFARPQPRPRAESKVDLAAELALVREARTAEPDQALVLLARHAREFPSGALASEREALRAVASCQLDRLDQARAAVDRLAPLDPGPLLRQRVQAACDKKIELPTTVFTRGGDGSL